jgi:hypothetical protein
MPFVGSWQGLAWVMAAVALWYIGQLASLYTIEQYAFVLMIWGLVLSLTGREGFALLRTPLLLLLLMIPLPAFAMAYLSLPLQLLSS